MTLQSVRPLAWIVGAILLTVIITALVTGSSDPVSPAATTPARQPVHGRLQLLQVDRVVARADLGPDYLFTATAVRRGVKLGTLRGICAHLHGRTSQCNVKAMLEGGTITVADLLYQKRPGTGTVLGGTGHFHDVTGTVRSKRVEGKGVRLTFQFD